MEDRELLELAAKAAGVELCWFEVQAGDPDCAPGWYCTNVTAGGMWNPLADDGDALRLAAKLRLDMTFKAFGDDEVMVSDSEDRFPGWFSDPYEGDTAAALRRAIVRGAAAVAGAPAA